CADDDGNELMRKPRPQTNKTWDREHRHPCRRMQRTRDVARSVEFQERVHVAVAVGQIERAKVVEGSVTTHGRVPEPRDVCDTPREPDRGDHEQWTEKGSGGWAEAAGQCFRSDAVLRRVGERPAHMRVCAQSERPYSGTHRDRAGKAAVA